MTILNAEQKVAGFFPVSLFDEDVSLVIQKAFSSSIGVGLEVTGYKFVN